MTTSKEVRTKTKHIARAILALMHKITPNHPEPALAKAIARIRNRLGPLTRGGGR